MSKNGTIRNNICVGNDAHGIGLGGSFNVLKIVGKSLATLQTYEGVHIFGRDSGAIAVVDKVVQGPDGDPLVFLRQIYGDIFEEGEKVKEATVVDNVIINEGPRVMGFIEELIRPANISVIDNFCYNNGVDSENQIPTVSGIFIANTDNVTLNNNETGNFHVDSTQTFGPESFAFDGDEQEYGIGIVNSRNVTATNTTFIPGVWLDWVDYYATQSSENINID